MELKGEILEHGVILKIAYIMLHASSILKQFFVYFNHFGFFIIFN